MEHIFGKVAEHIGEVVEDKIKSAFGVEDKKEKKGGILSLFGGDKDKDDKDDDKKGGIFSLLGGDKDKDDKDGGFFSNILNKDEDAQKKTGFQGLFSEQEGASGGCDNEEMPRFDEGSNPGVGLNDGDVFNDLMDVAEEMSKGE